MGPNPGPGVKVSRGSRVSVVVPTYRRLDRLAECLSALQDSMLEGAEIIVVSDGGDEAAIRRLAAARAAVRVHHLPRNGGFAAAANAGIRACDREFVALLNDDCVPERGWLRPLLEHMESAPKVAACGAAIRQSDGSVVLGDRYVPWRSPRASAFSGPRDSQAPMPVFGVSAAAALFRRDAIERAGLFDESLGSFYEDVDLCFRLRLAGYSVVVVPAARVFHHQHSSFETQTMLYHVLRNDPLLFCKNMPASLALPLLPILAMRQLYQVVLYGMRGQATVCLRAKTAAVRDLPDCLARRRRTQRLRTIGALELARSFQL